MGRFAYTGISIVSEQKNIQFLISISIVYISQRPFFFRGNLYRSRMSTNKILSFCVAIFLTARCALTVKQRRSGRPFLCVTIARTHHVLRVRESILLAVAQEIVLKRSRTAPIARRNARLILGSKALQRVPADALPSAPVTLAALGAII